MRYNYLILFIIFSFSACVTPYQKATRRAQRALDKGDDEAAATAFDKACRIKPDSSVCRKARTLHKKIARQKINKAQAALAAGDLKQSAAQWRQARKHDPRNIKVKTFARKLSNAYLHNCFANEDALLSATRPNVMRLLWAGRCLMRSRKQIPLNVYRWRVDARLQEISDALQKKSTNSPLYYRLYLQNLKSCLLPSAQNMRTFFSQYQNYLRDLKPGLYLHSNARPLYHEGLCQALAARRKSSLYCKHQDQTRSDRDIDVTVNFFVGKITHKVQRLQRRASYRAGTQTVHNSEYDRARERYLIAERNFREVEQETQDRKALCESTRSSYACNRYNAIVNTYNARAQEYQNAKNAYQRSSPDIEQAVMRSKNYIVEKHQWDIAYKYQIQIADHPLYRHQDVYTFRDETSTGLPEAGIPSDPLLHVSGELVYDRVYGQILDKALTMFDDEIDATSQKEIERCALLKDEDLRIDCEVRVNIKYGSNILDAKEVAVLNDFRMGDFLQCSPVTRRRKLGMELKRANAVQRGEVSKYSPGIHYGDLISIKKVADDSPAQKAGLRAGDIILDINGLHAPDIAQSVRFLYSLEAEKKTVTIGVLRDGTRREISL